MKTHNNIMLTFRASTSLRQALELLAKQHKISRSSLIRVLLVASMSPSAAKIFSKKVVDTKATA